MLARMEERARVRLVGESTGGPWIFGRSVAPVDWKPKDGDLVDVEDERGQHVGTGFWNSRSDVRVRLLSRGKKSDVRHEREFLLRKLAAADRLRRKTLRLPDTTSAWRLCHAEGDDLPGLIVDKLADALVVEHHALAFWRRRALVEEVLLELHPGSKVVHRVPKGAADAEGFDPEESPRDVGEVEIEENGLKFLVAPGAGHKTGWFCDQRDNRLKVAQLCKGADVLDVCCNMGGFALQAAYSGAWRVRGVDLDEVVLERARDAARRNSLANVEFVHADGFDALRGVAREKDRPGVVVVDPHKLIRSRARDEEGLKKYSDWNSLAIAAVKPGGIVATFSCSGALDLPSWLGIVFRSARRAEREVRLLEILGAGPDHPQRPDFARSRYLKGALLAVD
jgi:23S rRNA (cytosine1962-C5)-methyltransferase